VLLSLFRKTAPARKIWDRLKDPMKNSTASDRTPISFLVFCLWVFVLLCRPQNYIDFLLPLRPALITTILMLFFMLGQSNNKNNFKFKDEKQIKLYVSLVAIFIFSIPFAGHRRIAFEFIFPDYCISFLFFFIFYLMVNTTKRLTTILFVTCFGSCMYFIMAILNGFGGRLQFSTTFDPNDLAYFALVFLPINMIFLNRGNSIIVRTICSVSLVLGFAVIFLTESRGGFVALIIAACVMLLWSPVITKPMKISLIVVSVLLVSLMPIKSERYSTLINIEEDYNLTSPTGRLSIWELGIDMMIANPLTGVGVGNFERAIAYARQDRGDPAKWQSPHNSLIEVGTEVGFVGLFLYILLSFNALRIFVRARMQTHNQTLRKIGDVLVIGFVGMMAAAMFLTQGYSFYWLFYIALSAVISQILQQEMKERAVQQKANLP
jgi:O-antigen ligase